MHLQFSSQHIAKRNKVAENNIDKWSNERDIKYYCRKYFTNAID